MPPRLTVVACTTFLLFVVILLRPFRPTLSVHSSYYRDVFGHSRPLRDWLRDEEARYTVAVEDRQQLIRKYGPTEVTVDSCVDPFAFPTAVAAPYYYATHHSPRSRPFTHSQQTGIRQMDIYILCVRRSFPFNPYVCLTLVGNSRGLFHPGIPVSPSRGTHRYTRRWRQVGLRSGSGS
jgi:hypothetical protein